MSILSVVYHRKRAKLTFAVGLLVLIGASTKAMAQAREEDRPWHACLVENAIKMATGPDSARTIAEAAITLCRSLEEPVRIAMDRAVEANLLRDGVAANAAEARRVRQSAEKSQGWPDFRVFMTDQVAAVVVQARAKSISK